MFLLCSWWEGTIRRGIANHPRPREGSLRQIFFSHSCNHYSLFSRALPRYLYQVQCGGLLLDTLVALSQLKHWETLERDTLQGGWWQAVGDIIERACLAHWNERSDQFLFLLWVWGGGVGGAGGQTRWKDHDWKCGKLCMFHLYGEEV